MQYLKTEEMARIYGALTNYIYARLNDTKASFGDLKNSRIEDKTNPRKCWLYPSDAFRDVLEAQKEGILEQLRIVNGRIGTLETKKEDILKRLRIVNKRIDSLDEWEAEHEKAQKT